MMAQATMASTTNMFLHMRAKRRKMVASSPIFSTYSGSFVLNTG
jgi:hypothetical protein